MIVQAQTKKILMESRILKKIGGGGGAFKLKLYIFIELNALDNAILYACYSSALYLFQNSDLKPKDPAFYEEYALSNNIRYCNYVIMIDHLLLGVILENVPNFTTKEVKSILYNISSLK